MPARSVQPVLPAQASSEPARGTNKANSSRFLLFAAFAAFWLATAAALVVRLPADQDGRLAASEAASFGCR